MGPARPLTGQRGPRCHPPPPPLPLDSSSPPGRRSRSKARAGPLRQRRPRFPQHTRRIPRKQSDARARLPTLDPLRTKKNNLTNPPVQRKHHPPPLLITRFGFRWPLFESRRSAMPRAAGAPSQPPRRSRRSNRAVVRESTGLTRRRSSRQRATLEFFHARQLRPRRWPEVDPESSHRQAQGRFESRPGPRPRDLFARGARASADLPDGGPFITARLSRSVSPCAAAA